MKKVCSFLRKLGRDEAGQGTAEYVLLLVLVVALVTLFGTPIKNALKSQVDKLTGNISSFDPGSGN